MPVFEDMLTQEQPVVRPAPRRRLRALRLTIVPSGPLTAQIAGAAGALVAVHGWWGWNATIAVASVAAIVLGALREAGKI